MPTNGQVTKRYVSAIDQMADRREIKKQIISIRREDDFKSWLSNMGAKKLFNPSNEQTDQAEYHSWQDMPLTQIISTTGSTVTGSGTATISVTGLPSDSQNMLVVGVTLKWAGGVARVMTVPSVSSFTALSVTGGNLTLVTGTALSAFTNGHEEASTGPAPQQYKLTKLTNCIQIFRNSFSMTDQEMMNGVEWEIDGQTHVIPLESIKNKALHDLHVSAALFMGTQSVARFSDAGATLVGANGNPIQYTRGFTEHTRLYGQQDTVSTTGVMTLGDLGDMEALMVSARAPYEYVLGGAHAAINVMSDFAKNLPSSGAMASPRLMIDGKDVDLEVETIMHGGFKLHLHSMGLLNNQEIMNTGTDRLVEAKTIHWMPMGMVSTLKNGLCPRFRFRYQKPKVMGGGGSSRNRTINEGTMEIITGGCAPEPTNSTLSAQTDLVTYAGFEAFNPQAFGGQRIFT